MKHKNIILSAVMLVLIFGLSAFAWFRPQDEFSLSERRKLARMPELSVKTVFSGKFMSDFEKYSQDQFPMRDAFRALKAETAVNVFGNLDNNGIYIHNGSAAKMEYPLFEKDIHHAAERFGYIYEKYLKNSGTKNYIAVIPDKNYYMAEESGHLMMDYAELDELLRSSMDWAEFISLSDTLSADDYYRTDTHWSQDRIIPAAERLAEAMGVSIDTDFEVRSTDRDFYGVYASQAALPMEPDRINYLTGRWTENCTVHDYQNGRDIPVYDMEKAAGKDPYEMFLSGPLSLLRIENPDADTDRELIIFRDSFAGSLAPLLISGYKSITLADIRYIHPDMLEKYIDFQGRDVLFLYSTSVLNNSATIK